MRITLLLLLWGVLLASCTEVTFLEAQPSGVKELNALPATIQGKYVVRDKDGNKTDTLLIESWGYHFKDAQDKDWLGRGVLSDSLVVKFYKDYYFVNFRSGDQWALRLLKQLPDGRIQFLSIDLEGEKRQDVINALSKKMKVKEIRRGDDTFYQIRPTKAQLMALINEGYFTGQTLEKRK